MSFGERIRARREELHMTQEDVRYQIDEDLSRQAVLKWENGQTRPQFSRLIALAVVLDVSLDDILADELEEYRRKMSK